MSQTIHIFRASRRWIVISLLSHVLLAMAFAESLKVDFNGSSAQTMAGFQAYTAQNEVTNTFGSRTYGAFGTGITITPTWAGSPPTNTSEQAQVRASGNGYSTNAADMIDLMIDWIGTDKRESPGNPFTLTISGLPAGNYGWLSYHHDTQDQHGTFNVTVNDANGSTTTSGLVISSTQSSSPPVTNLANVTKFIAAIKSDGTNPISFIFNLTSATNPVSTAFFVMNGFELTNSTVIAPQQTNATLRRLISPQQPMWFVHIDTWNYPDPQQIIDLIPPDIRPYVVMNISLSISHTPTNGQFQVAEYGYEIAKSWMRVCAQNRMWAMIQQSSGGFHQFSEFDLSVYEEFYRDYPNLLGFNYAEQFWGYDHPTDPLSAAWTDRINHFADLLKLSSKYGGYLVVSWCGNEFDANINPIGMLKRNSTFAAACQQYTKNYILCEKYTQQSYQSDMESVCLGAYLSGYSGQYGIRYDSTGWTDATGTNRNFTLATGGAPHLEHIMLTGETVIDAPELIWQQCFQEVGAAATSNGFSTRRWETFPQFGNVNVDLFRKILDGTVRIPTRQEVINRTKVVIVNDVNSGSNDEQYSSPMSLFEGLYQMDSDGNYRTNKSFFKKSGRYPTVPTVYQLNDAVAQSFQVKVNKSGYATRWPTIASKTNEFNTLFPQEYSGDLYAGRHENAWVVYNPYKTGQTATNSISFKYNTCDHVDLNFSQYTSGVMKEFSNSVTFYLANYDNVIYSGLKTNTITIYGSTAEPTYSYLDRGSNHLASVLSKTWSGGVFTLTVLQNGPLDMTVNCAGTGTGRLTAYTPAVLTPPASPMAYTGPLQFEAECFEYKNTSTNVTSGWYKPVRNYRGQGYLQFGTSSLAAVRDSVKVLKAGTYRLETRYAVTGANISTIDLYVNGIKVATPTFTQTATLSDWATNKLNVTLNAGTNNIEFRANAAAASSVYFDNIVVVPTAYGDGLVIQENNSGFRSVDGTIDGNYSGYTGAGFANTSDTNGASIYWGIYFDPSVVKSLTFRYACTNDRIGRLIVNGLEVASGISFPATASLTNWDYVTVYANITNGSAEVKLQSLSAAGLPNIDSVELLGGGPTNTSPTLTAITNRLIGAGVVLVITNSASDTDTPAQTLTFSLLVSPTNATINTNSGVLSWRPLVTQANSTNSFTVKVTDSGTPNLSATQSFLVTLNPLPPPQISSVTLNGGQLVLQAVGDSGPDYQIQTSTNLINWNTLFTTNSPAMPFVWTNSGLNSQKQFFRISAGPPF